MTDSLVERTKTYLFASEQEMIDARLPEPERVRLIRLRDMYVYWLGNPTLPDKSIVAEIKRKYALSTTMAYDDVRLIKIILGQLNQATEDYYRYLFMQRCEEGFQMARNNNDANAFARVLTALGKYCKLDKEKPLAPDYSVIIPQPFEITDDPTVAGFKKIPNVEEKARKMTERFIQDADYEIVTEPKIEDNE